MFYKELSEFKLKRYELIDIVSLRDWANAQIEAGAIGIDFDLETYDGYVEGSKFIAVRAETPEETASRELEAKARQRAELQQREARERALLSSLSAKYGDRP